MSVRLVEVSHSFGRPLFDPISHTFSPGRITGIVGPSGCGKSTLLGIVAGMIEPTTGRVERSSARCSWVFQNPYGVAKRRVLDHLSLPYLARGASRREADGRARELLSTFGLEDRAAVTFGALSGGEAQRLMLARAVASAPDLLLVDEPTAQLDRAMAAHVNDVMGHLAGGGATVVIATHDPATRDACDEIIDLASASG